VEAEIDDSHPTTWKDTMALQPDKLLGVGSSFKLYVLKALAAEVLHGKRSWRDIVELRDVDQSISSTDYKDWPDGAPVSLFGLAASMISKSDNTATDALIRVVGRDAIEKVLPSSRNIPFMSTRDFFILKSHGNEELLEKYRKCTDTDERRKVLASFAELPLPKPEDFPAEPTAHDIEWLFSARELCTAIDDVHSLAVVKINPGLAKKEEWDDIAYKGGSEPGVTNLTTRVRKGRHAFCISATWNSMNKASESSPFFLAYIALLGYLHSKLK